MTGWAETFHRHPRKTTRVRGSCQKLFKRQVWRLTDSYSWDNARARTRRIWFLWFCDSSVKGRTLHWRETATVTTLIPRWVEVRAADVPFETRKSKMSSRRTASEREWSAENGGARLIRLHMEGQKRGESDGRRVNVKLIKWAAKWKRGRSEDWSKGMGVDEDAKAGDGIYGRE